ncbi:MAG: phosphoglucosamine mutase [Candidatus Micrarchaeota archaeon]
MAKFFGTNGIRKKVEELSPEFVAGICAAFASYSKGGTILIGRDTRTSGEMIANAAIAGLTSAGARVVDLGVVPAPTVEFLVHKRKANGGIIVTAPHNPPEWNALKFVDGNGIGITSERGEEIERIYLEGKSKRAGWSDIKNVEKDERAIREHIDGIKKFVDCAKTEKKKLHVVLDCGNGTASLIAPYLFREMGCGVTTINSHPDGFFPGRNSEPSRENIADLVASVPLLKADLGIAWDGDADRVIFVDEKGSYIIGDKSFALCVKIKLAQKGVKKLSATTVATSNVVKEVTENAGGKLVYTAVGGPYLSEVIRKDGAAIAGEEVGGVIWPEIHPGKDGLFTAAKIVEAVCEKPLSKLIGELPEYYNSKTKIVCEGKKKFEAIEKLIGLAKKEGKGKLTLVDGIRIDFEKSWVIARPSGTENYIRVFAEAKSAEEAKTLMGKYAKMVEELCR